MLYGLYQAYADTMLPVRTAARISAGTLKALPFGLADQPLVRSAWAAQEVFADTALSHSRRPFGITAVPTTTGVVDVIEEVVDSTPFGSLLRFRKDTDVQGPRVLILAPLSGHFATLLTDTVETMLPDHDVYITDWANARGVPVSEGRFGFDEYVDHVVRFLNVLGPGAHLLAVCQPCVQALIVTAVMAESGDPCVPRTLTLMAGPDRHPHQPDGGERPGHHPPDRVVRAERDQHGAVALPRRRAAGLPRLHAAHRVPVDEHAPAHQEPLRAVPEPGRRQPRARPPPPASSTTSTSPCST